MGRSYGQIFPVQVNTMISAPYSPFIEDYASASFNRFSANLFVADLTATNYPVRLRIKIEGDNGISLRTKIGQEYGPIFLNGGQTTLITGFDLRELFDPNRLDFAGITRLDYLRTGLPESFYRFHVEVLDHGIGQVVSNPNAGFANIWLTSSDPPILNLPQKNAVIQNLVPQNIVFQWTPRHMFSPNVGSTEYDFKLVEVYPADRNVYDAINTSIPVYQTTTNQTALIYGITEPLLVEGKRYAWQVRAHSPGGRDRFRNSGFTEVYGFTYSGPCEVTDQFRVTPLPDGPLLAEWATDNRFSKYEVRFRKTGTKSWNVVSSTSNSISTAEVEPDTEYELQIRGYCSVFAPGFWSTSIFATTLGTSNQQDGCGVRNQFTTKITPDEVQINWEPLTNYYRLGFKARDRGTIRWRSYYPSATGVVLKREHFKSNEIEFQLSVMCLDGTLNNSDITFLKLDGSQTFVGNCELPTPLGVIVSGDSKEATISWNHSVHAKQYNLELTQEFSANSVLYRIHEPKITLPYLELNQTYHYSLTAKCEERNWSPLKEGTFVLTDESDGIVKTGDCFPPTRLSHQVTDSTKATVGWFKSDDAKGYRLALKESASGLWSEVLLKKSRNDHEYDNLLTATSYDYKIASICPDGLTSVFTDVKSFNTGDIETHSGPCDPVTMVTGKAPRSDIIHVSWKSESAHELFYVEYRVKGTKDWYEQVARDTSVFIDRMKSETTYEIRVSGQCGAKFSRLSKTVDVTTPGEDEDAEFVCGTPSLGPDLQNQNLIPVLKPYDEISFADFDVTVTKVDGSSPFSGEGKMPMPWMNRVSVSIEFEGVEVNDEMRVVSGKGWVKGLKLQLLDDKIQQQINQFVNNIQQHFNELDSALNYAQELDSLLRTLGDEFKTGRDSVRYDTLTDEELTQLLTSLDQQIKTLQEKPDLRSTIQTAQLSIQIAKVIKELTSRGIESTKEVVGLDARDGYIVNFEAIADDDERFDAYENEFSDLYENLTTQDDQDYYVPFYAVNPDGTSEVMAHVTVDNLIEDNLSFVTDNLTKIQLTSFDLNELSYEKVSDGLYKVTVLEEAKRVYAVYENEGKRQVLGKLNVFVPDPKEKRLVMVNASGLPDLFRHLPVSDAKPGDTGSRLHDVSDGQVNPVILASELNSIYKIPGITWTIDTTSFTDFSWDANGNGKLDTEEHRLMSRYSHEMSDLSDAYFKDHAKASNTAYLFIVPGFETDDGGRIVGYMPRGRDVGFISQGAGIKTYAHELGHGLFGLEHTWELDADQPEGSTDNLMDYGDGVGLIGAQWRQVKDPGISIYSFDENENSQGKQSYFDLDKLMTDVKKSSKKSAFPLDIAHYSSSVEIENYKDLARYVNWKNSFKLDGIRYKLKKAKTHKTGLQVRRVNFLRSKYTYDLKERCVGIIYMDADHPDDDLFSIHAKDCRTLRKAVEKMGLSDMPVVKIEKIVLEKLIEAEGKIPAYNFETLASFIKPIKDVERYAKILGYHGLKGLDFQTRLRMVTTYAAVQTYSEGTILSVLGSLPTSEIDKFHEELFKTYQGECVFEELLYRYDDLYWGRDGNFDRVLKILVSQAYSSNYGKAAAKKIESKLESFDSELAGEDLNIIVWNSSATEKIDLPVAGELKLSWYDTKLDCDKLRITRKNFKSGSGVENFESPDYHPLKDWVVFIDEVNDLAIPVPSVYVDVVRRIERNDRASFIIDMALNVATFATGAGVVVSGARGARLVLGVGEMVSGGMGLGGQIFKDELISVLGQSGYENYMRIIAVVDISSLSFTGIQALAKPAKSLWAKLSKVDLDQLSNVSENTRKRLSGLKEKLRKVFGGGGEQISNYYVGARQNAIVKYGKEAENLIYSKFPKNSGAVAEIINHYGFDGIKALKTVDNIQDAANEIIKGKTLYRHVGSGARYLDEMKKTGIVPANPNKTYLSLDKYDTPTEAISRMQLNGAWTDAVWRVEIEANQLVGKVEFPKAKWGDANYLEPITRSFPKFGKQIQKLEGGATQFITTEQIKVSKLVNLKTGEIIKF